MFGVWGSLGTGFLSLIAGFRGIPTELYEAAAMDGMKNRVQELWYVTLPYLRPQLLFASILSITGSFGIGDLSATLFGNPSPNYEAHTLALLISDYANQRMDMGMAVAGSMILFFLTVTFNKLANLFLHRIGS